LLCFAIAPLLGIRTEVDGDRSRELVRGAGDLGAAQKSSHNPQLENSGGIRRLLHL
jgi:hypothetical protein